MNHQLLFFCQKRLNADYWTKQLHSQIWRTNLSHFDQEILPASDNLGNDLLILEGSNILLSNLSLIERVRRTSQLPIMVIVASTNADERATYYEAGADDVIDTTVTKRELHARIFAILRRAFSLKEVDEFNIRECGDIIIDPSTWSAKCRDTELNLTSKEFNILALLMQSPGKLVKKTDLSQRFLLNDHSNSGRGLDAHICNIRKKISSITSAEKLKTVRGQGYVILSTTALV